MEQHCDIKPNQGDLGDSSPCFPWNNAPALTLDGCEKILHWFYEMDGRGILKNDFSSYASVLDCLAALFDISTQAQKEGRADILDKLQQCLLGKAFWQSLGKWINNEQIQIGIKRILALMPWDKGKIGGSELENAIKQARNGKFIKRKRGVRELSRYARRIFTDTDESPLNCGEIIPPVPTAAINSYKVSVIVPVYNMEEYLRRCLTSIMGQTHTNLEIICVDDGSTDSSSDILEKIAASDSRVKVIRQENAGLSAARNTALLHATAPYIIFADSDDWLELNAVEKSLTYMLCDSRVDMVCYLADVAYEDMYMRYEQQVVDGRTYHAQKYEGLHEMNASTICNSTVTVWNKMFKKEIIDRYRLQFPRGLLFEDNSFFAEYSLHARYAYYIGTPLYHYYQRTASIMGKAVRSKVHNRADRLGNFIIMYKHYELYGALEEYGIVMQHFMDTSLLLDYRSNDKPGKKFVLNTATEIAKLCNPELFTPGLIDTLRKRQYHKIEHLNYYKFSQKLFSIRKWRGKHVLRILGLKINL